MNIKEFVSKHKVVMHAERVPTSGDWAKMEGATSWVCTLSFSPTPGLHVTLSVPFSHGSAYGGDPPTIESVLETYQMDVSSVVGQSFEEWATDLGYSNDSIRAKKTYDECVLLHGRMREFFGESRFKELLECEVE